MSREASQDVSYEAVALPAWLRWDEERRSFFVRVAVQPGPDRQVVALAVDTLTPMDLGEGQAEPVPLDGVRWAEAWDPRTGTYAINVGVVPGDSLCVKVGLRYAHAPRDFWRQAC